MGWTDQMPYAQIVKALDCPSVLLQEEGRWNTI